MRSKAPLIVIVATLAFGLVAMSAFSRPRPSEIRTVMKAKLGHAQAVLEGLAMEDFPKIQRNAEALAALSQAAGWSVHDTPEYVKFSQDFRATVQSMANNAKAKKLEATTLDYLEMTMTCIKCHSYVRRVGVAQVPDFSTLGELALR